MKNNKHDYVFVFMYTNSYVYEIGRQRKRGLVTLLKKAERNKIHIGTDKEKWKTMEEAFTLGNH